MTYTLGDLNRGTIPKKQSEPPKAKAKRGGQRPAQKDYTADALRDLECARQNDLAAGLTDDPQYRAALLKTARDQREWATAYLRDR